MPRGRPAASATIGAEGLETLIQEIGRRLGESLGVALVAGIESGVQRAGGVPSVGAPAIAGKRKPGRPPKAASAAADQGTAACLVPACGRAAVAKGLCATHYRKARRLEMSDDLSAAQLSELAEDGRKARFTKKAG